MKIRLIDGFKIKNTLDPDFAVIEDNASKSYVPKNELWLEKSYAKEKDPIIKNHLGDRRLKSRLGQKKFNLFLKKRMREAIKRTTPEEIAKMKLENLGKEYGMKIFLVDGKAVREKLDPDFVLGGHWLVYPYVPKNEIWIDNVQDKRDAIFTFIHEVREAMLMKEGMRYDNAHDWALAAEKTARRDAGVGRYATDTDVV